MQFTEKKVLFFETMVYPSIHLQNIYPNSCLQNQESFQTTLNKYRQQNKEKLQTMLNNLSTSDTSSSSSNSSSNSRGNTNEEHNTEDDATNKQQKREKRRQKIVASYVQDNLLQRIDWRTGRKEFEGVNQDEAMGLVATLIETKLVNQRELPVYLPLSVGTSHSNYSNDSSSKNIVSLKIFGFKPPSLHTTKELLQLLGQRLPNLKDLVLECWNAFPLTEVLLSGIPEQLDHLTLDCTGHTALAETQIQLLNSISQLKYLRKNHPHHNLRHLSLFNYPIHEDQLTTLILEVLPMLPNLTRFDFRGVSIESFQRVTQRIAHSHRNRGTTSTSRNSSSSLRVVCLGRDLMFGTDDPRRDAESIVKDLLSVFPDLYQIDPLYHLIGPELKCELDLNYAGRRELGKDTAEDCTSQKQQQKYLQRQQHPQLPLSLWPKVLERAQQPFPKSTCVIPRPRGLDGMYYLLRHAAPPELLFVSNNNKNNR